LGKDTPLYNYPLTLSDEYRKEVPET